MQEWQEWDPRTDTDKRLSVSVLHRPRGQTLFDSRITGLLDCSAVPFPVPITFATSDRLWMREDRRDRAKVPTFSTFGDL